MQGSLGESRYMYMYSWVPSLITWNYHIVGWLDLNTKYLKTKKCSKLGSYGIFQVTFPSFLWGSLWFPVPLAHPQLKREEKGPGAWCRVHLELPKLLFKLICNWQQVGVSVSRSVSQTRVSVCVQQVYPFPSSETMCRERGVLSSAHGLHHPSAPMGWGAGAWLQACPPSCTRILWTLGFPRVHRLRNSTGEELGEDEGRRATGCLQLPGWSAVC